jgi:hypothetical protein
MTKNIYSQSMKDSTNASKTDTPKNISYEVENTSNPNIASFA